MKVLISSFVLLLSIGCFANQKGGGGNPDILSTRSGTSYQRVIKRKKMMRKMREFIKHSINLYRYFDYYDPGLFIDGLDYPRYKEIKNTLEAFLSKESDSRFVFKNKILNTNGKEVLYWSVPGIPHGEIHVNESLFESKYGAMLDQPLSFVKISDSSIFIHEAMILLGKLKTDDRYDYSIPVNHFFRYIMSEVFFNLSIDKYTYRLDSSTYHFQEDVRYEVRTEFVNMFKDLGCPKDLAGFLDYRFEWSKENYDTDLLYTLKKIDIFQKWYQGGPSTFATEREFAKGRTEIFEYDLGACL